MGPGVASIHEARSLPAKGKGSAGVGKAAPQTQMGAEMSWSDHRVVVKVVRASSCSFEWVFIVYPDVTCFI